MGEGHNINLPLCNANIDHDINAKPNTQGPKQNFWFPAVSNPRWKTITLVGIIGLSVIDPYITPVLSTSRSVQLRKIYLQNLKDKILWNWKLSNLYTTRTCFVLNRCHKNWIDLYKHSRETKIPSIKFKCAMLILRSWTILQVTT